MYVYYIHMSILTTNNPIISNVKYTHIGIGDGFGAQYQQLITSYVVCSIRNEKFVYTPRNKMEHNYDNDDEKDQKTCVVFMMTAQEKMNYSVKEWKDKNQEEEVSSSDSSSDEGPPAPVAPVGATKPPPKEKPKKDEKNASDKPEANKNSGVGSDDDNNLE